MASGDKMELLRGFLGSLPPGVAGGVARAVEVDRMNNGTVLPHDLILDSLRPTLREEGRAERANTPMRMFCRPFEDLLTNEPRQFKQKGRIARSSITPVWNWLGHDLIPGALNAFSISVKTAVLGLCGDEWKTRTTEFWKVSSDVLRAKLASESGRKAARQLLGSDAVVADAREMALMLAGGPEICELQDLLPRTIPSLTDEIAQSFRRVSDELRQHAPEAVPYLPLVVMKRLENEWEALRLPLPATAQRRDGATANPDTGLVGEMLLSAIEAHSAAILSARPNQFNADSLLKHLERFTTLSNGVVKEVELRRDGVWGQRLIKDRAAVAEVMDKFMAHAATEIFAALPAQKSGNSPDLWKLPDPEKCNRALSYARLVSGCRDMASVASFSASMKRADEEIATTLRSYNDEMVRELRDADEEKRLTAEQYAAVAAELTAILLGQEEGDYLRRRSLPAASSSAAA